ncbi:MAG: HAMP domain-containing sensor histidine kinase [Erythrobacter sp.]
MERQPTLLAARGVTDEEDRLLTADDALAQLQENCGGTLPGPLAVPELLELVTQSRSMKLKIARDFSAFAGDDVVSGFARIHPQPAGEGGGCEVMVENWQRRAVPEPNSRETARLLDEIDRASAEVFARLDARQCIQLLTGAAEDTTVLQASVDAAPGSIWTDHVKLEGMAHRQPMHWRLLDGAQCSFEGSARTWRIRLLPIGPATDEPTGFEMLLVADQPIDESAEGASASEPRHTQLVGSALAPVLRQPISRIVANAETIRARLAGPLRDEYSEYAGNIASAGQHLIGLLDDLADLEVVEAKGFSTDQDPVDLADAARRAAGILGVRARARNIELVLPIKDDAHIALGEFQRVLQILINLIGNAIAYSPVSSTVTIKAETQIDPKTVSVTVSDEGPGVGIDQVTHIFDKFERLGRGGDGGSGLGLYISHRLASAMDGELTVANPGQQGAAFRLTLPLYED